MPERVVDLLEPVDVEEHGGRNLPVAPGLEQRLFQPIREQEPVREIGQRIVERLMMVRGGLPAEVA